MCCICQCDKQADTLKIQAFMFKAKALLHICDESLSPYKSLSLFATNQCGQKCMKYVFMVQRPNPG